MATKKTIKKETPAPKAEKQKKTIDDLTSRQMELRYYILRLGVQYGNDNLKAVLEVIESEV